MHCCEILSSTFLMKSVLKTVHLLNQMKLIAKLMNKTRDIAVMHIPETVTQTRGGFLK